MKSLLRIAVSALGLALGAMPIAAQETIKIGAINPYSGALAQFGDEVTRGYELAAEALNAKGGVNGKQVVIVRGDAVNPQTGISTVESLVSTENVDAFIGTYISAVANAASDAAARFSKVYFDTHALATDLTERGLQNYIRVGPNALFFAEASVKGTLATIAPALNKEPKGLTIWIEHEDTIYGTSIAALQKKLFEEAGVTVAGVGSHNYKAVDLTDSILRAANANPDIWIATGYVPDNTLLLRTMRDQGFNPPAIVLVGTGDGKEFREAMGDFMDGVFVVGYPHADLAPDYAPGAADFVAAYKAKHGREPVAPQSLEAYSGMMIAADILAAAGSTELDKVVEAAKAIDKPLHTYPNGFGAKFDEKMQNQRANPNVTQWQGDNTVTVYPEDAMLPGAKLVNTPRG